MCRTCFICKYISSSLDRKSAFHFWHYLTSSKLALMYRMSMALMHVPSSLNIPLGHISPVNGLISLNYYSHFLLFLKLYV